MTIATNGRYIDADVESIETSRGVNPTIYTPFVVTRSSWIPYRSVEGDSFAVLAWRLWNDVSRWWEIADMNPQVYYPGEIEPGVTLRLPS